MSVELSEVERLRERLRMMPGGELLQFCDAARILCATWDAERRNPITKPNIVNKIIGTVGSQLHMILAVSIPSVSGIAKSNMTTSAFSSSNFSIPAYPFSASETAQLREPHSMRRILRVVSESSTTSTRNGIKTFY